jgi:hypothetical protein
MNNSDCAKDHLFKEIIKQEIDYNPRYTEKQKYEIKGIIDTGETIEDIIKSLLVYFSMQL